MPAAAQEQGCSLQLLSALLSAFSHPPPVPHTAPPALGRTSMTPKAPDEGAAAGAGPWAAEGLCGTEQEPCPAAWRWGAESQQLFLDNPSSASTGDFLSCGGLTGHKSGGDQSLTPLTRLGGAAVPGG